MVPNWHDVHASSILEGIWPWILLSSIIDSISNNNGWIRVLSFTWNTGWQYEKGCNPPILVVPTVNKFWPSLLSFLIFIQHLSEGGQSRSQDSPHMKRVRVGVLCRFGRGQAHRDNSVSVHSAKYIIYTHTIPKSNCNNNWWGHCTTAMNIWFRCKLIGSNRAIKTQKVFDSLVGVMSSAVTPEGPWLGRHPPSAAAVFSSPPPSHHPALPRLHAPCPLHQPLTEGEEYTPVVYTITKLVTSAMKLNPPHQCMPNSRASPKCPTDA